MISRYLGPFRLDEQDGILYKDGQPTALGRRATAVLRYLIDRQGLVVNKDRLIAAVWPGLSVEENNLTVQIATLRRVLGSVPGGEAWIKTLPRRGYQYVGPLSDEPVNNQTALPEQAASGTPERRPVTALLCEMIFSGVDADTRDLDDLRDAVRAFSGRVHEIVQRYHGLPVRHLGSRVLVLFGYPVTRERDAEQAVRAALEISTAEGEPRPGADTPAPCRIGIATGNVIMGGFISLGGSREHDVIGEVPDRAATLQMAAEPGTIVIDAQTRSLVGDLFECHDLDPVEPASSIRPVRRWRVARERSPESRFSALRGPQSSPLLGRDEELQLLLRRWARCEAGEGHTVLISGEPGIGKSRLAAALEEHLRDRPHRIIHFACSPDHQDSALYPFTASPDAIADFRHHDVTPNQTSPEQTEPRHAMSGHKALPQISRPPSSPVSDSVRPAGSRARPGRERTLETLARQIEASARGQPMLLLIEDAHWIDPTSRELLDLIIPRFHELPILMLVTFRPEFRPDWMGRPHVTVLTLNRLSTKDGLELARLVAGPANLSPRLFEQISKQADGIPLFVEELTKSVLEDEARARRSRLTIPPNLYASLMARLDRLGPVARQVAQAGAAIGQDFSYRLLHAVYPAPDHEMAACVDSLVAAGLLFRRGEPPDAVYSFKHALLRDAAYDSLLREHRRRLHAAIAKALEAQSPERLESEPEVIALHYSEAGLPQSAADYWAKAGRRFVAQSAMAEAAAHFQRALAQLALIPSTLARERQELELTIALAASSQTAKGLAAPETGQAFTHAMKLWEQLGCPVEYSRAPLGLSGYHTNRGDLEVAERLNADFLRLANGRGEPSLLCTAHAIAGRTLTFTGRFSEAREHLESAGKIYDQIPQRRSFSQYGLTPRTAADGYLALVLFCTGSPDRALAKVRDTTAYAYDVAHVPSMTLAHVFGATLFSLAGDDQALDDEVRSLLDLADEHEFLLYKAQGTIFLGWSNVRRGNVEKGLQQIQDGLASYRSSGSMVWLPFYMDILANAYEAAGQIEEALLQMDAATQIVSQTGERWYAAELARRKGELLLRQGDTEAASNLLHAAIRTAQTQGAMLWEQRASVNLAEVNPERDPNNEALT